MFTGLDEAVGVVESLVGGRLKVAPVGWASARHSIGLQSDTPWLADLTPNPSPPPFPTIVSEGASEGNSEGFASSTDPIALGESIAVNGCCLTVVASDPFLEFDLSEETFSRTTLGAFKPGSKVNLERAMRLGDRLGGHIVQGHVDGVGAVVSVREEAGSWVMRFSVPTGSERYLIDKGSVCLDGVSLTVVSPVGNEFEVAVIPHTWAYTNLSSLRIGDAVNVEFDVLAKHVERLMQR